nr:DUF1232 domain-containing protein [Exiguobacterium sp. s122]
MLLVAYAFSPIDLIPDFIPVLGYLDDLILLPLGILFIMRLVPSDILEECRMRVATQQKVKRPNWFAGVFILLVWAMAAYLILAYFIK